MMYGDYESAPLQMQDVGLQLQELFGFGYYHPTEQVSSFRSWSGTIHRGQGIDAISYVELDNRPTSDMSNMMGGLVLYWQGQTERTPIINSSMLVDRIDLLHQIVQVVSKTDQQRVRQTPIDPISEGIQQVLVEHRNY